jgi:hypothetical protein
MQSAGTRLQRRPECSAVQGICGGLTQFTPGSAPSIGLARRFSARQTDKRKEPVPMRIAIVNQAIDRIVPPNQNSVGVCTLGVARPLARYAKVLIYGLKDNHPGDCTHGYEMEFRLIPSTASDRTLVSAQKKSAKLFRRSTPLSTSRWLYPGYGRQVALDLKQQQCDVYSSSTLFAICTRDPCA